MEILVQTPVQAMLFFILYGITGVVPLIAALYLLLCRGNAFAPDVIPPGRLRRITYNTYINNLRINHFISRYQENATAQQPVGAQQLAQESGFRSYSTFGRAFMLRMGQSVTAWMRETAG